MRDKKTLIAIGGILAIAVVVIIFVLFSKSEPTVVDDDSTSPTIAQYALTYTNDGNVALYSIKEETKLDQVDLKTLSKKEESSSAAETTTKPDPKTEPKQEPKQEHEENDLGSCSCSDTHKDSVKVDATHKDSVKVDTYKDFVKTEEIVKKGDSAWKIQESLTPNRNIALMLKYVAEINGRLKLHPIYPGEKIIFLKEMSNEDKGENKHSSEEAKEKPAKEEPVQENNSVLPAPTSSYLYFNDVKQKALFVYSNNDKAIYKITVSGNKLNVQEVGKNNEFVTAKGIYATTDLILLAENGTKKLQIYDIGSKNIRNIELKGILTNWVVQGDELYYTYENRLNKFNLKSNEQRDVLLGDESIDMVLLQDKLYILSAFGNQVDNSLLMKVEPADLRVDDFIELKSNMVSILSKGEEEKLYIGRIEKEKDLDGETKETPKIALINTKNLSIESNKWEMPFADESMGYNSYLYMLKDNKLNIYPFNSTDPIQSIDVSGEAFTIVP